MHLALHRLADDVAGDPVAGALRRFANALPERPEVAPLPSTANERPQPATLLYDALAEGTLDARGFDRGMLLARRAARYSPPPEPMTLPMASPGGVIGSSLGSPSSSLSSGTTMGVSAAG